MVAFPKWGGRQNLPNPMPKMGVSENVVYPNDPMVLLIIIPMKNGYNCIKWLFHWEHTLFSDKPKWIKMGDFNRDSSGEPGRLGPSFLRRNSHLTNPLSRGWRRCKWRPNSVATLQLGWGWGKLFVWRTSIFQQGALSRYLVCGFNQYLIWLVVSIIFYVP